MIILSPGLMGSHLDRRKDTVSSGLMSLSTSCRSLDRRVKFLVAWGSNFACLMLCDGSLGQIEDIRQCWVRSHQYYQSPEPLERSRELIVMLNLNLTWVLGLTASGQS